LSGAELAAAADFNLALLYQGAGLDIAAVADSRALQALWWPLTEAWLSEAAAASALAVNSAACLLDLESVVLDGSFIRKLLTALRAA